MDLTPEQHKLTPEELKKDVAARIAESILQTIDPDIHVEWVKAADLKVGFRRVIQMKG